MCQRNSAYISILEFSLYKLLTVTSTHPVDEKRLDELYNLQSDQETDGDQVVEKDDEGEKVEAKVGCSAIYQRMSYRHRRVIHRKLISLSS